MSRFGTFCFFLVLAITKANAASYEVKPTVTGCSRSINTYFATVFDNKTGRVFECRVIQRLTGDFSLSATCWKMRRHMGAIVASPDIDTTLQKKSAPLPLGAEYWAIWQINSATGDLQFCMETLGANRTPPPAPPSSCIKLDYLNTTLDEPPKEPRRRGSHR